MLIYISIFIVALIYYYLSKFQSRRYSVKALAFFMLLLAIFVGLGDMIGGYDRYIYGEAFDTIADETWTGRNYLRVVYLKNGNEWGYFFWEILMSFITENRYIFILFTTLLTYLLFFRAIKIYIDDYPLCCIIFLGFMYYFTMTYLREVVAVGIAWQGVHYIWERKPLKFFLIMLVAATFHTSVFIFAVMYFIPFKKFSKKSILRLLFAFLLIGVTPIPLWIMGIAGDTTGKGDYSAQDQGFRIEYVVEVVFIVWVLFKNYRYIGREKKTLVFLNMCYVLCAILMMFMRFGQGGRFGWPFFLGLFYMFTMIANRAGVNKHLKGLMILVSFALFMRITLFWGNINLLPYKTFLTDGIPSAPNVYDRYEYDVRYTNDKFYRPAFTFKNYSKNR